MSLDARPRPRGLRVRSMTCVFLTHDGAMLLMHRAPTMEIAPGLWAGLGGHLEPEELRDPEVCALREVEEESGIGPSDIEDLRLQAVVLRRRPTEIRLMYMYFGRSTTERLGATTEGSLHWIARDDLLARPMSAAIRFTLERYLRGGLTDDVWVGTLGKGDDGPAIVWATLADWEAAR